MGFRNDNDRYIIPTIFLICILIACALLHIFYRCIKPYPQGDDPLCRQERGEIQQGCYPWDDEYTDEEDDKEEPFTGNDHGFLDGKGYEERTRHARECQGVGEKEPILEGKATQTDYGSIAAPTNSLTSKGLSERPSWTVRLANRNERILHQHAATTLFANAHVHQDTIC